MVIEKHISNFHATYDELTREVLLAMNSFVPERLQEWFSHLDGEPEAAAAIQKLQAGQDFSHWFAMQGRSPQPGAPRLQWPEGNDKRLGMQLLLFRSMARGDINAGVLGKIYIPGSGRNINDNAKAFIDQVFRPMSRELIRYLRRVGEEKAEEPVPAADRVVSLDHNSPKYKAAADALETLENALTEANDYPDAEDKEQKIAEVSATRRLLQAARVRVTAVGALVGTSLLYLATTFFNTGVGQAAKFAWEQIVALLGPMLH
jgi:hypothetical protein